MRKRVFATVGLAAALMLAGPTAAFANDGWHHGRAGCGGWGWHGHRHHHHHHRGGDWNRGWNHSNDGWNCGWNHGNDGWNGWTGL